MVVISQLSDHCQEDIEVLRERNLMELRHTRRVFQVAIMSHGNALVLVIECWKHLSGEPEESLTLLTHVQSETLCVLKTMTVR